MQMLIPFFMYNIMHLLVYMLLLYGNLALCAILLTFLIFELKFNVKQFITFVAQYLSSGPENKLL